MSLEPIIIPGTPETRGRKRAYHANRAATMQERVGKHRGAKMEIRKSNIAVLDMETDPFNKEEQTVIFPFAACLYSDNFEPVIIWEEDNELFVEKVLSAIEALPEEYTIYAHNGGKFDYMFLLHKLRGTVQFKGRGIMSARVGNHELRDSFHIIPEKLASFQKDAFDYEKMKKGERQKHKKEIIDYLLNDCIYLLDIVKGFIDRFGLKISIGQAALAQLRRHYKVGTIGENTDASLRNYFFGGRVECLAGRGLFRGDYRLYDVNSMYPYVMANFNHPISGDYTRRLKGKINDKTVFVELTCRNYGALVAREEDGSTTATKDYGRFFTTIWEFETALELNLIDKVRIHSYIDCAQRSNFSAFVMPLYNERLATKTRLKELAKEGFSESSREYLDTKKDDIFLKLLLNNAFGKFAQNPRRYKESYITEASAEPPEGFEAPAPAFECPHYAIWQRPSPNRRYNNVGTAASITGASRAVLMRAIANSVDPIYCDTDSLICRDIDNAKIDPIELGAWDIEDTFSEVIITGKKQYAGRFAVPKLTKDGQKTEFKIRSKGVSGLVWDDFERMLDAEIIEVVNKAPTLMKTGRQFYMARNVRATAPLNKRTVITKRRVA